MAGHRAACRPRQPTSRCRAPERIAQGFFGYRALPPDACEGDAQTREVVRAGKVAAVLPIDVGRDEIVLIRQFRLPAHLANGKGELVEIVAGRVEQGEQPADTARRECAEEIGVAPWALVELFSYLTTPGLTDEEVTVFLAAVDASRVPERTHATAGERIERHARGRRCRARRACRRAPCTTARWSSRCNGWRSTAARVAALLRAGTGAG